MTYFSLRKPAAEPEPEPEAGEEQPEEVEEEVVKEAPKPRSYGPVLTGLLGPGQWVAARYGTGAAWGVHAVAVWAIGFYGGWVASIVIAVWLIVVLAFIPRAHLEKAADWVEHRSAGHTPTAVDDESDEVSSDPLVAVMWKLIGGAPGVHLKALAEHLTAATPGEAVDRAAVRAKLAARHIPVRASVRDAAGRVNEGVHRADLQAWEEALPAPSSMPLPGARSSPCSDALTSTVGTRRKPGATPLSRLRARLSRGVS